MRLAIQNSAEATDQEGGVIDLELARLAFIVKRAEGIPADRIPDVLSQLAALQGNLAAVQAKLIARMTRSWMNDTVQKDDLLERWLTADEAAELLKVNRKWLYRRANALPFARRLSQKKLLFSESGLRRWMASRQP